ncbi:hypothetical protein ACQEVC_03055 [Plantactinospora sp. CA-294935]|uniref:hypothetical protein n=1 Tax=Plantactinospora sp. CA-294935 TaxID=3240012 RepID=UPI003D8DBAD5
MNRVPEPVIGWIGLSGIEPRRAALADVLVALADHRSPADRCADLFGRYPGLTLVLLLPGAVGIASPGPARDADHRTGARGGRPSGTGVRLDAGLRDGLLLTLSLDRPIHPTPSRPARAGDGPEEPDPVRVEEIAGWIYAHWSLGVDLAGSAGRRLAAIVGLRLHARTARWSCRRRRSAPTRAPAQLGQVPIDVDRS